jgi:hypothetical protein
MIITPVPSYAVAAIKDDGAPSTASSDIEYIKSGVPQSLGP